MKPRFADTSFYIALIHQGDADHQRAKALSLAWGGEVVTTEHVLVETGNWLSHSATRGAFSDLVAALRGDPLTKIVHASASLFDAGLGLYQQRPDKSWSMTDCMSFVAMREHGLEEALTADRHFVQAGFRALLLEDA